MCVHPHLPKMLRLEIVRCKKTILNLHYTPHFTSLPLPSIPPPALTFPLPPPLPLQNPIPIPCPATPYHTKVSLSHSHGLSLKGKGDSKRYTWILECVLYNMLYMKVFFLSLLSRGSKPSALYLTIAYSCSLLAHSHNLPPPPPPQKGMLLQLSSASL